MPRTRVELFQFVCPECGMGDAELGHLTTAEEIHCVVCLIDEERYVRLRRWLAEEGVSDEASTAPALG